MNTKLTHFAAAIAAALSIAGYANAQAPVTDVNGSDVESRLTVLERQVQNRAQMQHKLQQQLDDMQYEVDQLRGAVETHTNQLQKVLERQRELYLEIDKRVEALKQSGVVGSATSQPVTATPTTSDNTVASSLSGVSESEAYDNAVNLILKSREYDKAIPAFQEFLSTFPNSEYAPNAHYWLGQLLFNKQQWGDAKAQFDVVVNRFTDSTKRPDAMLKLGVIAQQQAQQAKAKEWFQKVISEYPNSSARKLAEARL